MRVGPYVVEATLGEGGMGVVYRARGPSGVVALKVPREPGSRFAREAGIRIDHPNVVRVLDASDDYLALEILEGETLATRLSRGVLAHAEAVAIFAQAARGLGAVHARGIVHRDIKPSNVFLCADGVVKLLDFGVAHAGAHTLTASGAIVGTLDYLSPEQANGGPADLRADIWALGVSLHEALVGAPPFRAETPLATLVKILVGEVTSSDPVVMRALAKDPAMRFASADAFREALERGVDAVPRPDRMVVVLRARSIGDPWALERAAREHGGAVVADREVMVAVFGSERSEGDEIERALDVASRARAWASDVAIGAGRGENIELSSIEAFRSRIASPTARPFVGRERELARLREGGGFSLVIGPIGIGKSRLIAEAVPNAHVLRATPHRRAIFAPLVDVALVDDLQLAIDRTRLATLDALAALRVPLILDDLHHADRASIDLLEEALDRSPALRVIAAARPSLLETYPQLVSGRTLDLISLKPLTPEAALAMMPALPNAAAIAARAGGNPLFVEHLVACAGNAELPLTIEAAIQAHLDGLAPPERDLVRRAALFEQPISATEAQALGAVPRFDALRRRDLVEPRDEGRYALKSPLVAEVAYRSIDDVERAHLHRRAAEIATEPGQRARHYERAGEAALAAASYVAAATNAAQRGDVDTILRSTEAAVRLGAPEASRFALAIARIEALRFLRSRDEQAAAIDDAIAYARTDDERAQALSERAVWLIRTGNALEAREAADEAVALASQSAIRVLALGRQALADIALGGLDRADRSLKEAASLGTHEALVLEWNAQLASARGDLEARRRAFSELATYHRAHGDPRRAAGAASNLADVYNRIGDYPRAIDELTAARADCVRIGHRTMEGYTLLNLGYARARLGRVAEAIEALQAAHEIATSMNEARLDVLVDVYRARVTADAELALAAATKASARGLEGIRVNALAVAALACLSAGRTEEAVVHATEAKASLAALGAIEEDEDEVERAYAEAIKAR